MAQTAATEAGGRAERLRERVAAALREADEGRNGS